MKQLRKQISEILIKWSMPTRQPAISEIISLFPKPIPSVGCKVCKPKPNGFIPVEDVNDPHCLACGREILSMENIKPTPQTDKTTWTSGCEVCENCKKGKVCIERLKEEREEEYRCTCHKASRCGHCVDNFDVYRGKLIKKIEKEYSLKVYDEKDEKFTEGNKIGYNEGILTERKFVLSLLEIERDK